MLSLYSFDNSVGIGAFVIGLSQISSVFLFISYFHSSRLIVIQTDDDTIVYRMHLCNLPRVAVNAESTVRMSKCKNIYIYLLTAKVMQYQRCNRFLLSYNKSHFLFFIIQKL